MTARPLLLIATVTAVFCSAYLAVTHPASGSRPAPPTRVLPNAGLLAYYSLAGDAVDRSGRGNDGEVVGAVPALDRHGRPGGALAFDGVDDYVRVPPIISSEAFTVSLWVRGNPRPKSAFFFQGFRECFLVCDDAGRPTFGIQLIDMNQYLVRGTRITPEWTHIVGMYMAGETLRLYMNGQLVDSLHAPPLFDYNSTAFGSSIGAVYGGAIDFFQGSIDDVRVYDRLLSPTEVFLLYRE